MAGAGAEPEEGEEEREEKETGLDRGTGGFLTGGVEEGIGGEETEVGIGAGVTGVSERGGGGRGEEERGGGETEEGEFDFESGDSEPRASRRARVEMAEE